VQGMIRSNSIMALLPGEWANEARETAFLEDRSVNSMCEVV
jgi:hypothetical protein